MSAMDRRSFFKIVATTGAAAAAGGCGPSAGTLLPYVVPPDNIVPGVPAYFSTVCRECPAGCGIVAKNRDGRVVKLEGNPDHPLNTGALCIRGHAGLQGLYHPDRFRGPLAKGQPVAWEDAEKQVAEKIAALVGGKQGARIVSVDRFNERPRPAHFGRYQSQRVHRSAHRDVANRLRASAAAPSTTSTTAATTTTRSA